VNNGVIWVNGVQVTDNCTEPLSQDLQAALDKLRSAKFNATAAKSVPTTAPSDNFFSNSFDNFFANLQKKMADIFAATSLAINSSIQSTSDFVEVVQNKVGPNVTIQSLVAVDKCIWVNGIPIDKFLANSSKLNFNNTFRLILSLN
jgi:hypothetical protein